jgi:protein-S-isoprenylcysteine O-methyltransferase Ste14
MKPGFKSAVYASFGVGMLVGVVPQLLLHYARGPAFANAAGIRWAGAALAATGAWVYFGCVVDFARRGGTPAFWDAPGTLVLNPWFRAVRNPMYAGVTAMIVGRGLWGGSLAVVAWAAVVAAWFHGFVVLYEEPHLRSVFAGRYDAYCERVPRWMPRPIRRLTLGAVWQNLRT